MLTLNDRLMWCLKITGCYIQLLADGSPPEPKLQFVCIHLAYISAHTQHYSVVYTYTPHVLLTAICSFVRRSGIYWVQINNFWHVRQEATNVSRESASSIFTALYILEAQAAGSSDTFSPQCFLLRYVRVRCTETLTDGKTLKLLNGKSTVKKNYIY